MAKKTRKSSSSTRKGGPKKKTSSRTATKKPARTRTASKKTAKATTKRATTRKKAARSTSSKRPAKKAPARTSGKKAPAKKRSGVKKTSARKTSATKAASKTSTRSRTSASKKTSKTAKTKKKTTTKTTAPKNAPASKASAPEKKDDPKKPTRKGITIVSDRPKKRRSAPKPPTAKFPPTGARLLGPGAPARKPLIPSGPSRAAEVARERAATERSEKKIKSPFNKRELDKFRGVLLAKRLELFGDMSTMETGALRSESGGLSHTPQHLAEQGSDSYDQSLSLDLAAADRRLIKEIDDALQRIADKTFGICELTGKPISKTRLEELPWARYSIEAARELERRSGYRA